MTRNLYRTFFVLITMSTMLGGGMVHEANASHLTTTTNPTCTCSASARFSRPELQFVNGVLTFIPRVDLSFSSRGKSNAPGWTAKVAYSGSSSYSSKNISVPAGVTFSSDEKTVASGMCGSKYTLKGYQLQNVPLSGVVASLLGKKQEMDGKITMQAQLSGCEVVALQQAFTFRLKELGNLSVGSWRTVR